MKSPPENEDYYPDQLETLGGYARLQSHLQQSGEYAIIHGTDERDHYCMDHDCETWITEEDQALFDAELEA